MSRKCIAYLATVVVPIAAQRLENISIVYEFLVVFLPKLITMLPEREVEFIIDMVPKIMPISKAPYRMVSAELKELKKQLRDVLNKGFVRQVYRLGEHQYY